MYHTNEKFKHNHVNTISPKMMSINYLLVVLFFNTKWLMIFCDNFLVSNFFFVEMTKSLDNFPSMKIQFFFEATAII